MYITRAQLEWLPNLRDSDMIFSKCQHSNIKLYVQQGAALSEKGLFAKDLK